MLRKDPLATDAAANLAGAAGVGVFAPATPRLVHGLHPRSCGAVGASLIVALTTVFASAGGGAAAYARARPATLVTVRGRIGAFAQDGERIAWLWPTASCRNFAQLRDLRTRKQVRLAAPRGATCPPADGYVDGALALAGDRALWSVYDVSGGLSSVDFRIYLVEGQVGKRDRVVAHYDDEEEKDDSGNVPLPTVPMAGDSRTLVYAYGGAVRRVSSGRGVKIGKLELKPGDTFGLGGGRLAIASAASPGGCVCNSGAVWSPDGTRIAFESGRSGASEIYLVSADGTGERRLVAGSSFDWSPNGKEIVFHSDVGATANSIVVVNADGTGERPLVVGWSPAWSPDEKEIAYNAGTGELRVMNADGNGSRRLTGTGGDLLAGPVWSPDGAQLAFNGGLQLSVIGRDGTGQHTVGQSTTATPSFAWSPDGRRIAYTANDLSRSGGGVDVHVVNADGSGDHPLTGPGGADGGLAWSPNGREIAFLRGSSVSREDGSLINPRLWIMNADGTAQRKLTRANANEYSPSWSPDSTRITFTRDGELYVVGSDGAGEMRLTTTHPTEPRSAGGLFAASSGQKLSTFEVAGQVRAIALTPTVLAVLVKEVLGERIELFDPRSGKPRGGVVVDARTADSLSAASNRIVLPVDRTIMLLNAATKRLTQLAVAAVPPIGLSIEGRRVAWAENLPGRARVRALTAP